MQEFKPLGYFENGIDHRLHIMQEFKPLGYFENGIDHRLHIMQEFKPLGYFVNGIDDKSDGQLHHWAVSCLGIDLTLKEHQIGECFSGLCSILVEFSDQNPSVHCCMMLCLLTIIVNSTQQTFRHLTISILNTLMG